MASNKCEIGGLHMTTLDANKFKEIVSAVATDVALMQASLQFSHIAVCGASGAIVGAPVSFITGIPLMVVRKNSDVSHGDSIEGAGELTSYIFLDDFISSGATFKHVLNRVANKTRRYKIPCVAGYFYVPIHAPRKLFSHLYPFKGYGEVTIPCCYR